jgi:AcrR family transcriptional regulator
MASATKAHHGNRHGHSEEARVAILQAADDLLVEKGFDGVTMEGIAKQAGVAKQTVYRWWRSKADVLLDAFLQDAVEDLEPPDTGDIAVDLPEYLHRLAVFLGESDEGAVFRALMAKAQLDPEFARVFRERCLEPARARSLVLLERAVERGQLPEGLDAAAEMELLVAPIFYRVLVTAEPITRTFTDSLALSLLQQLRASAI